MNAYKWPLLLSLGSVAGLLIALVWDGPADVLGVALVTAPLVLVLALARRARPPAST